MDQAFGVWMLPCDGKWTLPRRHRELFRCGRSDIFDFLSALVPRGGELCEEADKSDASSAGLKRKVRAAVERLGIRREEDRHRPSAVTCHPLDRCHIDFIDIRTFFAVDLNGDVVRVEELGDLLIFKGFVLHDMAPVAGSVADGKKDGDIQFARKRKGFFTPRPPVHRVVCMLPQVWRLFVDEAVFEARALAVG